MMRFRILYTILLLWSISGYTWADTTGKIIGQIVDELGDPLPGANIEVTGSEIVGRTGATAGLDGRYEVSNLPAGRYVVKVTYVGYVTHTAKEVQVLTGDSPTELTDFRSDADER